MKKFLLTTMMLLAMASASAFGMYGYGDSWIDFLTHGNQFRARMDQLGFVLGNGTIKGTFGFRANTGWMGNILNVPTNQPTDFSPTVSVGIGYTSDMIGIGLGYNFTYINKDMQVHTPVLALNALNNNLRIAAPIQVADADNYTGIAFNNIQLRYFTGVDAFNAIRLYFYYRNNTSDVDTKYTSEAFGFQVRLYFLRTQIGNVTVNPYVRIDYHTALKGGTIENYVAHGRISGLSGGQKQSDIYDVSPFKVFVKPVLSLAASSDTVSLYFEPSLGYAVVSSKYKGADQVTTHALNWGAYAELYVRPVQDLEWYFEMDVNGNVNKKANADLPPVLFETTTGITWYLPSLGGNQ
ncbi:cell surface protein [uncultured Brachyspira sp.]|uniref:cell surface protein n=1 Tax=uncultured Brachyspira sp. TaxID=221953 RepID=UPI0026118DE3|nr:cell surface protein [uncultured Brachyspira sp.]